MAHTPLPLTMSGCIEMLGLRCLIAPKCRPESVSRHMAGISQAAAPFHLPPSNGGRDTLSTTTLSTTTLPHCLTVHPTLQGLQTPGNRSHGPADWHVREVPGGAAASDYTDLTLALEDGTVFSRDNAKQGWNCDCKGTYEVAPFSEHHFLFHAMVT